LNHPGALNSFPESLHEKYLQNIHVDFEKADESPLSPFHEKLQNLKPGNNIN
jgi:hypothetical protein